MVGVKEVESECRLRLVERRRVPTHPYKLVVILHPVRSLFAQTELHIQVVDPIHVKNKDLLREHGGWARGVLVANIKVETQLRKAGTLIKTVSPNLQS